MTRKFPSFLSHDHTPEAIQNRLQGQKKTSGVRDLIYGGTDGIVTTFAIVAGVRGADLAEITILILGLSNVLADGFSMASGNYLATKADYDEFKLLAEYERSQIKLNPQGEEEEVKQIFLGKGFQGEVLDKIVKTITENKTLWLKTMLVEEYGLPETLPRPMRSALITFSAFVVFGILPLAPYLFKISDSFFWSTLMAGLAFFILGALKSLWSLEAAWISGLKTLVIGSMAAGLAFGVGSMLKGLS